MKNQVDTSVLISEDWHTKSTNSVFTLLETSTDGLDQEEVEKRLESYGPNQLPVVQTRSAFLRFIYQFHNILIYVLLAAGIVTAILEHWVDAGVIFAVVLLNALIGFIQEGKAEDALRSIQQMLSPHAIVIRNGRQGTIQAEDLVPGDIVTLQSGDKVPADLRLFRVKGLQIQESALTGESIAVEKMTDPVGKESVIGDRSCMAYSGTIVTHGQGSGIVIGTGAHTQIGRISSLVSEVEAVTTPLLRQMAQFGRWLTIAILGISLITFAFGLWVRDYAASEMFLAAVSLAVAAIPEGLPAIMTITLAIGVQRMAKRHAIIRKLPAVETLGAVTVICSDKTGTLTRNEMTVSTIATAKDLFQLSGTGYDPHGEISLSGRAVLAEERPLLEEVARAAMLCNDASLEQKNGEWFVHGDPMEGALLIAALKAGLDMEMEAKEYPRTDLIPFESEHRFMATLHHDHAGDTFIFLKGAPEQILEMCTYQRSLDGDQPLDKHYWLERIEELAGHGQRVLALASKPAKPKQEELAFSDLEGGLIMLGMLGLIDPPREEAIEAVQVCNKAGIRVKMITGDHGATARAIAKQLKLVNTDDVLTGTELESMSEEELRQRVLDVDIYARVNPEHKLCLVRSLQEHGLIVAMTGDGVNDAPALKRADVGTAMGHNGTEAAKEASEMVLADDNFASIIHAVEEGRTVYDNLKKAILFILPTNGGEALIILAAIAFGFHQMPLIPVQILWVNMVTAVTLALSLAFEPPEQNVMQRPPRDAHEPILTGYLIWRIAYVSMILMGGTFGLFIWEMEQGASIAHAQTVAVNTLIMFEIFYLFNSRYITGSVLNWEGLSGNRYVLIAIAILVILQLGFTYLGPMQSLFGSTAIDFTIWLRIVLVASSVLFLVELEKYVVRYRDTNKRSV
ncbi:MULTISPECIES: cation-transporting P-type ATPase [Sulfurovum]|uniref:Cation-transporting P-type ATPase n=1 Tax=Sulfurovum xiamenensis TaxID=3019066 RepID=A0ABT7QR14_9BACT|nr:MULTISPECIES: cation-transporting P-type ATPase [Sulfurovum]EIF51603.1 ATPase, E1-E2 type [Sulfurovum sp. AR]MDM5263547.1 cation-transporting P-type ATPase [Sulfurovum xiamenensis]